MYLTDVLVSDHRSDKKFVTEGFSYWHDGRRKFLKHENSDTHRNSISALQRHHSGHVDELLNKDIKKTKLDNREMLRTVVECLRYLSRQGLPIRGNYQEGKETAEPDGNLNQALLTLAKFDSEITRLLRRTHTYTSPEVQNELLHIMGTQVQRQLIDEVKKAGCYTIMLDETPDISGHEQLVICFR